MVKGIYDTARFDQIFFDKPYLYYTTKIENIIKGANRDTTLSAICYIFINKTESILVGAGRKAYFYINRRISRLKSIVREQAIRFRVKRGL